MIYEFNWHCVINVVWECTKFFGRVLFRTRRKVTRRVDYVSLSPEKEWRRRFALSIIGIANMIILRPRGRR